MTLQDLPQPIAEAIAPLLDVLPLEQAMEQLVVSEPAPKRAVEAAAQVVEHPAIAAHPPLAAGLWLYVDELDRSHRISQGIDDPTGSYWHAIMHRREGDFSNSLYWLRRTGQHPAMKLVGDDYDPAALVREVERAAGAGSDGGGGGGSRGDGLVERQRREWATLFAWCAKQGC